MFGPGGISLSPGLFFVRLASMLSRVFGLLTALTLSGHAAELVFNFGESASDQIPAGFTNVLAGKGAPGVWKVVMDDMPSAFTPLTDKAPSTSRRAVLAQTSMDLTDEHFPMLVYTKETFDDFTVTTRFKLVEGVSEQMAGLVFRWQDEKNYYVVRASGLGNNVRFYKVVDGARGQIIGPEVAVPKRVWHALKIDCRGNKITVWLDDQLVIPELTDSSFRSGKIGYWTKSDSVSHFTDTRITYTPRVPPAQQLVDDTLAKYPRLIGLKVYLLDDYGEARVVAGKTPAEVGGAGGKAEKAAITSGGIFYGKSRESVAVVQPLRDRNGEPIAAVRVTMTTFLGQTEQNALQRALPIVKYMQARVSRLDELK